MIGCILLDSDRNAAVKSVAEFWSMPSMIEQVPQGWLKEKARQAAAAAEAA